ncbi:MAG: hypothetical protein LBG61_07660 [Burkholderiales bacterium]|jgi:hypothetical protein|nr:hypothetical protein [Burkholderiales bacterium]
MSKRGITLFAFLFLFSSFAFAEKVDCDKFSSSDLPYLSYGITTPSKESGWKCFAGQLSEGALGIWENGEKKFLFSEDRIHTTEEQSRLLYNNSDEPELIKELKYKFSMFLGDKAFVEKNNAAQALVKEAALKTKAILFSEYNNQIAVYSDEIPTKRKGKFYTSHTVAIFKKDGNGKYLGASCTGCTADEFFSMVINPAIQNPIGNTIRDQASLEKAYREKMEAITKNAQIEAKKAQTEMRKSK